MTKARTITAIIILMLTPAIFLTTLESAAAQEGEGDVQQFRGRVEPGAGDIYRLSDLLEGEVIYWYAEGVSGNLDPIGVLIEGDRDPGDASAQFFEGVDRAIEAGEDPLAAVPDLANSLFLAWDDDSGTGYASAFAYTIPADGDYQFAVASSPGQDTFGEYELILGLDSPDVLTGQVQPRGEPFAELDLQAKIKSSGADEVTGELTQDIDSTFFSLHDLDPGDTLSVFVEATTGNLRPILILRDFGGKPIATGNITGGSDTAMMEFTFGAPARNYQIDLEAGSIGNEDSTGEYRLVAAVNEPAEQADVSTSGPRPVIRQAIPVAIGLQMQQITSVDQISENFGVVATMLMEWNDPNLAFSPDDCDCSFKTFADNEFTNFATDNDIAWPAFTIFNQQGNRWTQNRIAVVFPEGQARYFERFSTTLQAPDFDFTRFPFDQQMFFIRIDSIFPEEFFVFEEMEDFSGLGEQLGEEEWVITDVGTEVTSEIASTRSQTSRFSFRFEARRHLEFYIFRIFVPILIIIIVSWATFFLKDYGKRVDVAGGNLLLFIAFNFTISSELPRLGYLTFLDTILITTFVVTGLVLVFNVALKRLEIGGREQLAQWIDKYTVWIYPIAYIIAFVTVTIFFT